MNPDHAQIQGVVERYLDGLYHCDTELLGSVFHPRALYATAVGPEPLFLSMDEYFPIVEKRDPPARTQAPRRERLISVELAGPVTAFVKLECSFFQKDYIDYLTLIRVDGRWQIIAKVFHYEPSPPEPAATAATKG
jgi:hypothetical protein